uniref:Neurotransmitter-gated ion-channel ligand-binding domain-containing protein n=1 Tax=Romanomermis culicivorax TaxID=13658 RepID=A0A915L8J9_ROMCU
MFADTSAKKHEETVHFRLMREKDNIKAKHGQAIVDGLMDTYDSTLRPWKYTAKSQESGRNIELPVNISVFLHILSLSSFNDVTMTFTVQFRFLQQWIDDRLTFDDPMFGENDQLILSSDMPLWLPDTFFQNEQYGHYHLIDQFNEFRRIRSDGQIQYSRRLTMNFSCPMNLMLFPHDTQTCHIEFSSYAYTTKDIAYEWGSPVPLLIDGIDYMPKFSLANVTNGTCNSVTATGNYSCLRVSLVLRREFSYFLLQLYLPSGMMVAVGCVSFWIDWRSAPARVPLAIVTLLTITTQSH